MRGCGTAILMEPFRIVPMLARFPLEIHIWTIPLLFATGYVIGYFRFRRRHPELYAEWEQRRNAAGGAAGDDGAVPAGMRQEERP